MAANPPIRPDARLDGFPDTRDFGPTGSRADVSISRASSSTATARHERDRRRSSFALVRAAAPVQVAAASSASCHRPPDAIGRGTSAPAWRRAGHHSSHFFVPRLWPTSARTSWSRFRCPWVERQTPPVPRRFGTCCGWSSEPETPTRSRRLRRPRPRHGASTSPHFSPGAVMIAEDFGLCTHGHVRVLATESIAGTTVEGARARHGPCVHGAKRPARARPAQSAIGTIIDIAVKTSETQELDADKRPGEYPCCQIDRLRGCQGKRRGLPRHEGRRVKAAKAVDAGTLRGSPCQAASRLLHFVPALRVTRRAPQRRGR